MRLYVIPDCSGNVISAAWYKAAPDGAIQVDELPAPSDGSEFRCEKFKIIDGEWVELDIDSQSSAECNPMPSPEDRIAALESALLELVLGGGV